VGSNPTLSATHVMFSSRRRHDRPGRGATLPASATPDLSVPDIATVARVTTAPAC